MKQYIYKGIKYNQFEDIPLTKKDLPKKDEVVKCKRAEYIQFCYKMLLEKGLIELPEVNLFDRISKERFTTKIANFLNIPVHNSYGYISNSNDILKYEEPLKVAINIFKEQN